MLVPSLFHTIRYTLRMFLIDMLNSNWFWIMLFACMSSLIAWVFGVLFLL